MQARAVARYDLAHLRSLALTAISGATMPQEAAVPFSTPSLFGRRRLLLTGAAAIAAGAWPAAELSAQSRGQVQPPRQTIGTVSATEFFLTVTISATFLISIGLEGLTSDVLEPMLGLLIGGVVAAPLGAIVAKKVPTRGLLVMVGLVLTVTSAYSVWKALGS